MQRLRERERESEWFEDEMGMGWDGIGRRLYFLVGARGFLRGVFFSLFSPALP